MTDARWMVLDEAHQALRTVVAGVSPDDWRRPTPCTLWNVTQVLQHAAGDQLGYASKLTGGPGPDYDPFAPSGTLDVSPAELLDPALTRSADAFSSVDPSAPEVLVPVPPFALPAKLAVEAAALDAAIHAWDIAAATGQPSPLTPSLARALRPVADALVEPLRGFAYGPPIAPTVGADEPSSLLNYLGRRADWTP
jgi:uncharacterized protein (TIGR03086 family)